MRWQRLYVAGLSVALAAQGLLGLAVKAVQDRLAGDWVHNLIHLCSGLAGLLCWRAGVHRAFAVAFGVLYTLLGIAGWWWDDPTGAFPLGAGDNVFHLAVGVGTIG